MPEISVILNNYNYGEFIGEAIQSVLAQDFSDFELIVVDDGSTDCSRREIEKWNDARIRTIFKANGGQLSAFHAGLAVATGGILCFLDSDDRYSPEYLGAVSRFFGGHADCGLLLTGMEYFGARNGRMPFPYPEGRLGGRAFSVAVLHQWCGVPTSGCALRRELVRRFLPWPEGEGEWRLRADDLLVWGAEVAGGIKFYQATPSVYYRVHARNAFCGREESASAELTRRRLAAENFCRMVMRRNGLDWAALLEGESRYGGLLPDRRLTALLKLGRDRMVGGREFWRCIQVLVRTYWRQIVGVRGGVGVH